MKTKEVSTSARGNTSAKENSICAKNLPVHIIEDPSSSTVCSDAATLMEYESSSETDLMSSDRIFQYRNLTLQKIYNQPKLYIGLLKPFLYILNSIIVQSKEKVKELDLIITLFKLKHNDCTERVCEQFEISKPTFTTSFHRGIQVLAAYLQNIIFVPTLLQLKQNLPLSFKIRHSNVHMILDAFEIEIEKPHDPKRQAQTWSQYKHCNTVKYLVGCTPNGFINFISKGYGGRISDKALVEKSNLIEVLPTGSVVMADRGFKELGSLFASRGIKLLKPPSVYAAKKPTKEEVMQTKIIASLRIHVERVIRRLREFRMLKPHSTVNHKHVGYLNYLVIIACGLNNLQHEIIKTA